MILVVPPENPEISEIWTARIYFKGRSGRNKARPILIVNYHEDNGLYTIQEITTEEPKEPITYFEACKEFVKKWSEAGLDDESYVKCSPTNTHRIERTRLKKYVGVMDEDDFENIIEKIHDAKMKYRK